MHAVPGTILYVVVWTQNWCGTNTDGFNNIVGCKVCALQLRVFLLYFSALGGARS